MSKPTLFRADTGKKAATKLVEAAPGVFVTPTVAPEDVPRYGICHLKRQPDGSYIPVLRQYGSMVRMGRDLLAKAGLEALSLRTLYRLVAAGFVKHRRPAPNLILVDLGSLAQHLEDSADPEFWTAARLEQFRRAEAKPTRG